MVSWVWWLWWAEVRLLVEIVRQRNARKRNGFSGKCMN